MDIWSVLKACLRRWYVFLPALALTAWFAWSQMQTMPPTYLATSSATIVGPALVPGNDPGEIVEVNPFERLGGSLTATGSVMASVMDAVPKREQFLEQGVTADYEVSQDDAILYFDVEGADAGDVIATATRLPEILDVELARLQQRAVEAPESRIRAVTLTVPTAAEEDPVAGIRVLAVLLALGVILAIALALLADALIPQLARRGRPGADDAAPAATTRPEGAAAAPAGSSPAAARPAQPAAPDGGGDPHATQPLTVPVPVRDDVPATDPVAFGAAVGAAVGAVVEAHEPRHADPTHDALDASGSTSPGEGAEDSLSAAGAAPRHSRGD